MATPILVFAGAAAFLILYTEYVRFRDDPGFAQEVFGPVAPRAETLASRRWHPRGSEPWDCTFAIVRLPSDAPSRPPEVADPASHWALRLPSVWSPTPAPPLGDTTRDAVSACRHNWPDAIGADIAAALSTQGAFYARDRIGVTLHIWSAPHSIAARVRFGD